MRTEELEALARRIRAEVVRMSHRAGSPHLGSSLSCVDILVAAYFDVLKIDPKNPDDWTPPKGWKETPAGEKTGGKHRQWVDEEGKMRRRWDRDTTSIFGMKTFRRKKDWQISNYQQLEMENGRRQTRYKIIRGIADFFPRKLSLPGFTKEKWLHISSDKEQARPRSLCFGEPESPAGSRGTRGRVG